MLCCFCNFVKMKRFCGRACTNTKAHTRTVRQCSEFLTGNTADLCVHLPRYLRPFQQPGDSFAAVVKAGYIINKKHKQCLQ